MYAVIEHFAIFSLMLMFFFGVLHHKRMYQVSLFAVAISLALLTVRDYGVLGLVYAVTALVGIILSVWVLFNVASYFLWKSASKGTPDEGKPSPANGSLKNVLKVLLGIA